MSFVRTEHRGATCVLTLSDPARRNILSAELSHDLIDAVAAANADPAIKAIVVTGEGKAFCAGANLADLEAAAAGRTDAVTLVYQSFLAVADSPLPTIAAVNGPAVGAGLNLALACDFRIASAAALFDTRFFQLGLHPGGGCTWMLLRAVGWTQASRMLLIAQEVASEEALRIGLITEVVEAERLVERACVIASALTNVPRELVMRTKASLRHAVTANHAAAVAHETVEQMRSLREPAFAEAIARLKAPR